MLPDVAKTAARRVVRVGALETLAVTQAIAGFASGVE